MLTSKGKYGLKALVHLAGLPAGATAQSAEIAAANAIPKKFLDAILGDLRMAGLVSTRKGKGGGYRLARAPGEITVGAAIRVLDGPLAPIACASRTAWRPCQDCAGQYASGEGGVGPCPVRAMMAEVREAMAKVLDTTTLDEMRHKGEAGADLMYHI